MCAVLAITGWGCLVSPLAAQEDGIDRILTGQSRSRFENRNAILLDAASDFSILIVDAGGLPSEEFGLRVSCSHSVK
jgi:hypothetical protein